MERGEKTIHDLVTTFTRALRQREEQLSIGFAADLAQFISEIHDLIEAEYEKKHKPQGVDAGSEKPERVDPVAPGGEAAKEIQVCDDGSHQPEDAAGNVGVVIGQPHVRPQSPFLVLGADNPTRPLTACEQRILNLQREGKKLTEIASTEGLAPGTVKSKLTYIRQAGYHVPAMRPPVTEETRRKMSERVKARWDRIKAIETNTLTSVA